MKEKSNELLSKETEITTLNGKINEIMNKVVIVEQNLESTKEMYDSKVKNEDSLNSIIQKLNQELLDSQDTILKLKKD